MPLRMKCKVMYVGDSDGNLDTDISKIQTTINNFLATMVPEMVFSVIINQGRPMYASRVATGCNQRFPWWYLITILYKENVP